MSDPSHSERPEPVDAQAAFARLQKLTKALLGVPKDEYDRKRTAYEQGLRTKKDRQHDST